MSEKLCVSERHVIYGKMLEIVEKADYRSNRAKINAKVAEAAAVNDRVRSRSLAKASQRVIR